MRLAPACPHRSPGHTPVSVLGVGSVLRVLFISPALPRFVFFRVLWRLEASGLCSLRGCGCVWVGLPCGPVLGDSECPWASRDGLSLFVSTDPGPPGLGLSALSRLPLSQLP